MENLIQQDLAAAIASDGVPPTPDLPAKDGPEGREGRLQRKRGEGLLFAFGGLNAAGQKSVMRHIRELDQVPAYQAQPYLSGFAPEDRQMVEAELATIKNVRYEECMTFVSTDQGTFEFQSVDDAIKFVQTAAKKRTLLGSPGMGDIPAWLSALTDRMQQLIFSK